MSELAKEITNMVAIKALNCTIIGLMAYSSTLATAQAPKHHRLSAPTYYIAINGMFEGPDAIRLKGAANLPPGSNIELFVAELYGDIGVKGYSTPICVTVGKSGFFKAEFHPETGAAFHSGLFAVATLSFDNTCKQPLAVRKIIGETGQYLGNDNYDDSFKRTWELTPGMNSNPQFEQTTRWHFGLYTIARIQ